MKLVSFFVFLGLFSFSVWAVIGRHQRQTFEYVCDKVEDEIFLSSHQIKKWARGCRHAAAQIKNSCGLTETDCLIKQMNQQLLKLNVSHLYINSPVESQEVYYHIGKDTGLRVRLIEDSFVVYEVLPRSPAEAAKIKRGDVILGKDGYEIRFEEEVKTEGVFTVERDGKSFEVKIDGEVIQEDFRPQVVELDAKNGLLKLPSFEGDYQNKPLFDKAEWMETAENFFRFPHLIIDLRGNIGGNFAAMLRGLSPFLCEPTTIGAIGKMEDIKKAELSSAKTVDFPDHLEPDVQIQTLYENPVVRLKTFEGYGCYKGKVTILVDTDSASAAEIFAEALRLRPGTRVFGHPTSGNVLVGKREEIPFLPSGFVLNIPIAVYITSKNEILERNGVRPDVLLHYELSEAMSGKDSWVQRSLLP